MSLSPSSIDFADTAANGDVPSETVRLRNHGTGRLAVSSIVVSAPFTVAPATLELDAGQAAELTVQFAPTTQGASAGIAEVRHNGFGGKSEIRLSGTGT